MLPHWLEHRSEWLYEREWRVPVDDTSIFRFALDEVAFLVVPSVDRFQAWVRDVIAVDRLLGRSLGQMRYVVIGGEGVVAANGVASRKASHELTTRNRDN